jgi:hypothetical protein
LFGLCLAAVGFSGAGCPLCPQTGSADSSLDPQLIGAWKLTAATVGGVTTTCPGEDANSGFSCGDDEQLTLNADGSYAETLSSTIDDAGVWFAVNGLLMLDDELRADNPGAFTYTVDGNTLTAQTLGGALVAVYARQGEPSTLTEADIVAANPGLDSARLVDTNLVGKWEYVSIEYQDTLVVCPGTSAIPGIFCGEHEWVRYSADSTFEETISNTEHAAGVWYALNGVLLLDDTVREDYDPSAWTYTIQGDVLIMRTFDADLISTLHRVQE